MENIKKRIESVIVGLKDDNQLETNSLLIHIREEIIKELENILV